MNVNEESRRVMAAVDWSDKHKWVLEVGGAGQAQFRRTFYGEDGGEAAQFPVDVRSVVGFPSDQWERELDRIAMEKLLASDSRAPSLYAVKVYPSGDWGLVRREPKRKTDDTE